MKTIPLSTEDLQNMDYNDLKNYYEGLKAILKDGCEFGHEGEIIKLSDEDYCELEEYAHKVACELDTMDEFDNFAKTLTI